ncbi:MAG: MFS transporter [Spirochaetota bacterium]
MNNPDRLFNKNFVLLWQGQLVSQIGNQAYRIAIMFWLMQVTESSTLMGIIMMFSFLPAFFISPIAGTIADIYSRKKIIILSDIIGGAVLTLFAVFMLYLDSNPELNWNNNPATITLVVVFLFIVSILIGVLNSFFMPTIGAVIPDIVPKNKIMKANSLKLISRHLSRFIGQSAGGVLFRIIGAPLLLLIDGLSFIFSAVSESFISIPQLSAEDKKADLKANLIRSFKREFLEGFRYAWNNKGLRNLIFVIAFINFLFMPIIILLPFHTENYLNVTADWYGFMMAADGLGIVLGAMLTSNINVSGKKRSIFTLISLFISSAATILLGITRIPLLALLCIFISGFFIGIVAVTIEAIAQISSPAKIRGRVLGFITMINSGIIPMAMGISGIIGDLLNHNTPLIFIVSGCIAVLLSILVFIDPAPRKFLEYEPEDETPNIINKIPKH